MVVAALCLVVLAGAVITGGTGDRDDDPDVVAGSPVRKAARSQEGGWGRQKKQEGPRVDERGTGAAGGTNVRPSSAWEAIGGPESAEYDKAVVDLRALCIVDPREVPHVRPTKPGKGRYMSLLTTNGVVSTGLPEERLVQVEKGYMEHLEAAIAVGPPDRDRELNRMLSGPIRAAVRWVSKKGQAIAKERRDKVGKINKIFASIAHLDEGLRGARPKGVPPGVDIVAGAVKLSAVCALIDAIGHPDLDLGRALRDGFDVLGYIDDSMTFRVVEQPPEPEIQSHVRSSDGRRGLRGVAVQGGDGTNALRGCSQRQARCRVRAANARGPDGGRGAGALDGEVHGPPGTAKAFQE